MECNKDEAKRSKEIAIKKLLEKDIKGANKFASKAQNLYPELEGISEMIDTINVYLSAENKINGEGNWYGILGLKPLSDEETIRKQFRKLALTFHPDKNQSVGAEGAFKLISEAWSLLSDKNKKLSYDSRLFKGPNKHFPGPNKGPFGSGPVPGPNGFNDVEKSKSFRVTKDSGPNKTVPGPNGFNEVEKGKNSKNVGPTSKKEKDKDSTFWTVCHRCKMQYEYLRMYLNQNLLCPDCREAFFAVEISPSFTNGYKKAFNDDVAPRQQKKSGSGTTTSSSNFEWVPCAGSAAQAAGMVRRAYEKVKKERQEAQAALKRAEKKARGSKRPGFGHGPNPGPEKRRKVDPVKPVTTVLKACDFTDMKQVLIHKAKIEINKVINISKELVQIKDGLKEVIHEEEGYNCHKKFLSDEVPESEFYNFERLRNENCFKEKQIWGVYDYKDGMPRIYAKIQKIVSFTPLKMKISWLKSEKKSDFFPSFGEFRLGGREIIDFNSINCFSHEVKWSKGKTGIQIYPKRGEIWCLYSNWSIDNEFNDNELLQKYELVSIFEDYDEKEGVFVVPLVKIAGYKNVFRKNLSFEKIKMIRNEEMSRFSHNIPVYKLIGKESLDGLKGCLEVDPAATPLELLQVIDDFNETEEKMMM